MNENDVLDRLIEILCAERGEKPAKCAPEHKHDYFRALCNVREPAPVTDEFLRLQDIYLSERTKKRGVVDVNDFRYDDGIALWQGDITRLNADAVVNACNEYLLGCFHPLHGCIDNIIHSNAGVQLRLECNEIMKGGVEPTGKVKVTPAYNLPSKYVFHTVGPIVSGVVTDKNRADLRSCYLSCLEQAGKMSLNTIAFCCLSTGVYAFPKREACKIALSTVREWKAKNDKLKIIFNVFTDEDRTIYEQELGLRK